MADDLHFTRLSHELSTRAARAVVGHLAPASLALREHLAVRLASEVGAGASFLAPPVFESLFPWALHDQPIEKETFLSSRLIKALDSPTGEFRFPRDRHPRTHQHAAWEVLCNDPARSVLVRTGTASGKTECFMIPVLNDLARELDASPQPTPIEGVRALFLYPLNALIQSQRNRLQAWSKGFDGLVRFALYNGAMRESVSKNDQGKQPEEVLSRTLLRESPPPVLVTNATMLEYMLVRGSDAPIIEKSEGKLRWIILDEAHTYLGSTAAEVALQLRRVMDAFKVDPVAVRLVATSATLGDASDQETTAKLQRFLADLGGILPSQVVVVDGHRVAPPLSPSAVAQHQALLPPSSLRQMPEAARFARMAETEAFRTVRAKLETGHLSREDARKIFYGEPATAAERVAADQNTLELLDLASGTWEVPGSTKVPPFLPLRGHFFLRTMAGLWACCDPQCSARAAHGPVGDDWPFGAVHLERRTRCECGALCFEMEFCRGCGAVGLAAFKSQPDRSGVERWTAEAPDDEDDPDSEETESADDQEPEAGRWERRKVLLLNVGKYVDAQGPVGMHRVTGELEDESADARAFSYMPGADGQMRCVRCREGHRADRPLFGPARLGTTFFLGVNSRTLLEQEEPAEGASVAGGPPKVPAEGRRLLTFTDSRQGSARFAMRAQLGAERNYLRASLYHSVWSRVGRPDPKELKELDEQIAELEELPPTARLRAKLPEFKTRRDLMIQGAPIAWSEMEKVLENDTVVAWIKQSMVEQFPPARGLTTRDIARFMLVREFARRPRRQNSLESMGLVALDYVGLDKVPEAAPQSWIDAGFRDDEWKPFLKICVDFFVRNHTALKLDREDFRWIGAHFSTPFILAPDGQSLPHRLYPWPSAPEKKVSTRLHRYLAALMTQPTEDKDKRPLINAVLRDAWHQVSPTVLTHTNDGWQLNLTEQGRFRVVRSAWLCPVTGRLLDVTLRGRSPYVPRDWTGSQTCIAVAMPALTNPFPGSSGVPGAVVRAWLETDPTVVEARRIGAWNEFSDRVAEFAPTLYFRAGEHSAQQDSELLQYLEREFNARKLNLLSCSTTMEMGVDIGGLNTVAMNNVPPSPANYRQRAGRAGRSDASRATVMTLCNTTPHGEEVFSHPLWPFESQVAVPAVSLQSRRIVERHVNALCLGCFFRANKVLKGLSLECAGFFRVTSAAPTGAPAESAMVERFVAWIEQRMNDGALDGSVTTLVRGTTLEGASTRQLLQRVIEGASEVRRRWSHQREMIVAQITELGGSEGMRREDTTPPQRGLLMQLARHDGEYLLRHLAAEGFLPTHGFPMNVVPFVNLTVETFKTVREVQAEKKAGREDALPVRRGFPSRHLGLAIREYAPGAEVVISGMVYDSAGVTLNWKIPASGTAVNEIQDLGYAWRCHQCGAADFERSWHDRCPQCQADKLRRDRMLRPSGFSVDFYSTPHNDIGRNVFVPVDDSWISASGAPWRVLGGTPVGRFRHAADGKVIFRSMGASRHGYAVCLHCGRATPETHHHGDASYQLPRDLVEHRSLRGGKDEKGLCPGTASPFAIQHNVVLGGRETTDVLEIQLFMPGTLVPIRDETVCATLAVAIRRAVAERLGVDPREIGWSTIPSSAAQGDSTRSLVLYDTAEGGAGYVAAVMPMLTEILQSLPNHLKCPRGCDRACHGCLLGYDTQWWASRLDRERAKKALPEAFFDALLLPKSLQVFGDATQLEHLSVEESVSIALQQNSAKAVRVHLGARGDWELEDWPLLSRLRRLVEEGAEVTLVMTEERLKSLTPSERENLLHHLVAGGFHLQASQKEVAAPSGSGVLVIEMEGAPSGARWAISGDAAWAPGEPWGQGEENLRVLKVRHEGPLPALGKGITRGVTLAELRPPTPPTTRRLEWAAGSLAGAVGFVGKRFWDGLRKEAPWLGARLDGSGKLVEVRVRDRYIQSPLHARVLYEVLHHLRKINAATAGTKFLLETQPASKSLKSWGSGKPLVYDDFASGDLQAAVLLELWKDLGAGTPIVKEGVHHDRVLELRWIDSRIRIDLHQGVTFLRAEPGVSLPPGLPALKLAEALRSISFDVVMPVSTTVHIGPLEKP